jgi:hypothetical protein
MQVASDLASLVFGRDYLRSCVHSGFGFQQRKMVRSGPDLIKRKATRWGNAGVATIYAFRTRENITATGILQTS